MRQLKLESELALPEEGLPVMHLRVKEKASADGLDSRLGG